MVQVGKTIFRGQNHNFTGSFLYLQAFINYFPAAEQNMLMEKIIRSKHFRDDNVSN